MARRMEQQKEYYWQGHGGADVTLGKIIAEMLGRDFDKITDNPNKGEPTDVYTLQFDCYNDDSAYEGHSIIHIPHNENLGVIFRMNIISDTGAVIGIDQSTSINNQLIDEIEDHGFAIYLRKIASNQPMRFDNS